MVSFTSAMSLGRDVVAGIAFLTPKSAVILPLAYPPGCLWGFCPPPKKGSLQQYAYTMARSAFVP
jgi:hypothetical protein